MTDIFKITISLTIGIFFSTIGIINAETNNLRSNLMRESEVYNLAEIYYVHWYSRSHHDENMSVAIADLRVNYQTKIIIRSGHEISGLINWLKVEDLDIFERKEDLEPYLVLDFYNKSGIKTTYISDGQYLYNENLSRKRKINTIFRKRFSFDPLVLSE